MRAVLLRRMMVLGVCGLGVAALYLVPGLGPSPTRVGVPEPLAEVTPRRTPPAQAPAADAGTTTDTASVAARYAPPPEPTSTGSASARAGAPDPSAPAVPVENATEDSSGAANRVTTADRPSPRAPSISTPFQAVPGADRSPPEPVDELAVRTSDTDRVRLSWAPARDDVGVVGYRVWLNGYEVQSTDATEVSLDWFNDDAQHVVVVKALDAAGNLSQTAATLLLRRPEPSVMSSPSSPAATTADSEPDATPTATPQATPRADETR